MVIMNPEGNAVVYCEGGFNTPNGKTAHGLVRFTKRYNVCSLVDSRYAGKDAGEVLDGKKYEIPIFSSVEEAIENAEKSGKKLSYMVMGLAPDGGRLPAFAKEHIKQAIKKGLHIDSGLHDFLSDDPEISALAQQCNVNLRDIRKTPNRNQLHFFSGKIEEVSALKIAILGTDSAVGKRTTAWALVQGMQEKGYRTQMVATGQTGWMQGIEHSIVLDSLINDFVSGEIEHVIWKAWQDGKPDVIVVHGQGSLLNPAYPGGFELLAAGRPDIIILQHAPARKEYDGFPGYPLHPLAKQIQVLEMISGKPVVAISINHEDLDKAQVPMVCDAIHKVVGLPAFDILLDTPDGLLKCIEPYIKKTNDLKGKK